MKKHILVIATALFLLCCFTRCKKDEVSLLNIVLYNQPLDTIQKYIQGKWKIVYVKGGFSSDYIQHFNDYFIEFTSNNRVKIPENDGTFLVDTIIEWTKEEGTYTNGEDTYTMNFYDKYNYPSAYVIDRIHNDTLIYHENAFDAVFFYCIKHN